MLPRFSLFCFFLSIILLPLAHGTEADYFTQRTNFPDSLPALNEKMNATLKEVSDGSTNCSEQELHFAMMDKMGGVVVSAIERWPEKLPGVFHPTFEESIYQGLQREAKFLKMGCCAPTFRMGPTLVSGDKLGHFLHSGYEMFYAASALTEDPIVDIRVLPLRMLDLWESPVAGPVVVKAKKALGLGERKISRDEYTKIADRFVLEVSDAQEEGGWGLTLTGVKSYSDMSANFDGFHFWSELTEGERPYFACKNFKWQQVREFNWAEYVTDAWDEGINCDGFVTKKMADTLAERVQTLAKAGNWPSQTCPVEPLKCAPLRKHYGEAANKMLSPECRAAGLEKL